MTTIILLLVGLFIVVPLFTALMMGGLGRHRDHLDAMAAKQPSRDHAAEQRRHAYRWN